MHADNELTKMLDRMILAVREAQTLAESARLCSEQGFSKRAMSLVFDTEELLRVAKRMFEATMVIRNPHPDKGV